MSSESLTVILAVGLIAGWLAAEHRGGTGYGIINTLSSASWVPLSAGGCCLNAVSTSALGIIAAVINADYRRGIAPFGSETCSRWEAAGTADGGDDGAWHR